MILDSENIRLRAVEKSDLDLIYQWENDPDLWHLSNTVAPFSRDTIKEYIATAKEDIYTAKQLRLIIVHKKTDSPIGAIDLYDLDCVNQRAAVGILIYSKEHRRKHLASESLNTLIEYAFFILNLKQLYCTILTNNESSMQLFKNCGFVEVGVKKEWVRHGRKWLDEAIYQRINTQLCN